MPNTASFTPQVPASSYDFAKYMTMPRWCSLWHQIRIIHSLQPKTILEVGVGNGLLRAICSHQGIEVRTIDIDPELKPDVVASVQKIPFEPQTVDLTCAFQVLESHDKMSSSVFQTRNEPTHKTSHYPSSENCSSCFLHRLGHTQK
jgi:hypothetical protein